ncbi:44_t:CDS:2 [Ambispora gerdemannii]|uniref:44_t:CDS:1 n=1 Tax=Ambispora gerdemannii TaxID=144530 RepID=A0A9N9C696_9GLOM|nr:44_t:CDS:2 [Ambispora gerdemannii]
MAANNEAEYTKKFACDIVCDPDDKATKKPVDLGLTYSNGAALIIKWLTMNPEGIGTLPDKKENQQFAAQVNKIHDEVQNGWTYEGEFTNYEKLNTGHTSKALFGKLKVNCSSFNPLKNYSFNPLRVDEYSNNFNEIRLPPKDQYELKCILDRIINLASEDRDVKGFITINYYKKGGKAPQIQAKYVGFYVNKKTATITLLGQQSGLFEYKPVNGLDNDMTTSFLALIVLKEVFVFDYQHETKNFAGLTVSAGYSNG